MIKKEQSLIRARLDGLRRISNSLYDISNHHYLTLSELNEWIKKKVLHQLAWELV
jgi:hypothetical protein